MKGRGWGGPRRGSGRPTEETARRVRIVVLINDDQAARLRALADKLELPVGTVAYQILERGLRRR